MKTLVAYTLAIISLFYFAGSILDTSILAVSNARDIRSAKMLCAESENAPIIKLDSRESIEAYLYACKGNQ